MPISLPQGVFRRFVALQLLQAAPDVVGDRRPRSFRRGQGLGALELGQRPFEVPRLEEGRPQVDVGLSLAQLEVGGRGRSGGDTGDAEEGAQEEQARAS